MRLKSRRHKTCLARADRRYRAGSQDQAEDIEAVRIDNRSSGTRNRERNTENTQINARTRPSAKIRGDTRENKRARPSRRAWPPSRQGQPVDREPSIAGESDARTGNSESKFETNETITIKTKAEAKVKKCGAIKTIYGAARKTNERRRQEVSGPIQLRRVTSDARTEVHEEEHRGSNTNERNSGEQSQRGNTSKTTPQKRHKQRMALQPGG